MSKIIRTEPNKVLAKAVEYHGFVYCQGVTASDLSKDIVGQTTEVLGWDRCHSGNAWHGQDPAPAGADLAEGYPRPRRYEFCLVRVAARGRRAGPRLRSGEHGGPPAPGRDHGHDLQIGQKLCSRHENDLR